MSKKNTDHFFKHRLLVAMPRLKDPNFNKAVIYLCEHSEEGAMGIVINKPLEINLGNVLSHLDITVKNETIENLPVMLGGPVGQEHGFVLHAPFKAPKKEDDQIIVSSSKETLRAIAKGKGPQQFIVSLGYSGWGKGQLEEEIQRNDWLVVPLDVNLLFNTPIDKRWKQSAELIGIDINKLTDQSGHA